MANRTPNFNPNVPDNAGNPETGAVYPGGQTQTAITDPGARMVSAGLNLMVGGFGSLSDEQKDDMGQMNNAIVGQMQNRWWKSQDEQFNQSSGQQYKDSSAALNVDYQDELARAAEIADPVERSQALGSAHQRMWSELAKLDQTYLDAAGKYSNNPIIANRAGQLIQQRTELMNKISGAGQQGAQQTSTEEGAGLKQAQAGQAKAAASEETGFYSKINSQAMSQMDQSTDPKDFIVTREGGREEIQEEVTEIMTRRQDALGQAMAQIKELEASGNQERVRDAYAKFEQMFFVHPDDLADEEGEALVNLWRTKAQGEVIDLAAQNVADRLRAAGRGFRPEQDTNAPAAPAVSESPQITPAQDKQRILPASAGPAQEAKVQLGVEMAETRELPDFNVKRAITAMGGDDVDEIAAAGQKAYDEVVKQYKAAGLDPPPNWNPKPDSVVANVVRGLYADLPDLAEVKARRKKARGAKTTKVDKSKVLQTYLDGLSSKVQAIFNIPKDAATGYPEGVTRDAAIWINLNQLVVDFLKKYPDQKLTVTQLVEGALANLAAREGTKEATVAKEPKRKSPGRAARMLGKGKKKK